MMDKSKKWSVNYNISFGIDVTKDEVDKLRRSFGDGYDSDSYFDIEITKDSSDEQLAKFIGLQNYKHAEAVDLSDLEVERY